MANYFYAYHGPKNHSSFDSSGGYGVSKESKIDQVKIGDLVYIIQKIKQENNYELCGLYKITGTYHDETSKRPHRVHLKKSSRNSNFIPINEKEFNKKLPRIKGNKKWSTFQRYFCRQGVSFQSPLEDVIIAALDELLNSNSTNNKSMLEDLSKLESKFKEQITISAKFSSEERIKRLLKANKKPKIIQASTTIFTRNPDVVAETLFRAKGICEECGNPAPFKRKIDGSPYLEVHHIKMLCNGGDDTIENTKAVCPNCHRRFHFGE